MGDERQSGRDIAAGSKASAPASGGALTWPGLVARFAELAAPIERRPIGKVTEARYLQVRLRAEALGWRAVLGGARSRSAHDVARAALGRACVATGRDLLAEAGRQGSERMVGRAGEALSSWREALGKVVAGLERCRPVEAGGMAWTRPKGGPRRLGKRRGLASLPADWRALMMTHTPEQGPYGLAIACLWLLGVRPGELVRGVRVMVEADGVVLAEIQGGKLRNVPGEAPRGQPLRRIAVRGGRGTEEAVARLRRALARVETRVLLVQIADARRLSDALRATSRRVFPGQAYTVSPYSFRHAWSADTKAGATSGGKTGGKTGGEAGAATRQADDVSLALGHAAARTRTAYGTRAQGGRGGGITLVAVQASEPLRGAGRSPFEPPSSPASMPAGATGLEPA
jgi:integrase